MSQRATRRKNSVPAPVSGPRRVLIVDDSFLMRRVIRGIVESDPQLQVAGEAADGIEALQRVAELAPDLVLLDIEMPRLDGIGFLRQARLLCAAPVIVISSVAQPGSPRALLALELGACDILPKPSGVLSVDLEKKRGAELLAAIREALPA